MRHRDDPRPMKIRTAAILGIVTGGVLVSAWTKPSMGFKEDYPDGGAPSRSSAHGDLTKALAYCAGFTASEAGTIADADEATDLETYDAVTFHFTKRTGPNEQYFHFPGVGNTLGEITSWTSGVGNLTLAGGSCFSCC